MDGTAPEAKIATRRTTRGAAIAALIVLFAAGLGLRAWNYRAFLPYVLHSDAGQLDHATDFLLDGKFINRAPYPPAGVFIYVGVDYAAYWLGKWTGHYRSWEDCKLLLTDGADPTLRHAVARMYTAIAGAFLCIAVYRLARVYFSRNISLLAAAMAALSPVHVIYSHQARIHVPGIVLLTFAAAPVARWMRKGGGGGRAALAGAACGAAASMIQLGYLLFAAGAASALLLVRPWRRAIVSCAAAGGGFAAAAGVLYLLSRPSGVVLPLPPAVHAGDETILGIPKATLGVFTFARFIEYFPVFVARWCAAEPAVAAGAVIYSISALARRERRRAWLCYCVYPAILFIALGTSYTVVRYSMSATPMLAPIAAAGIIHFRFRPIRYVLMALAVAIPASLSICYDRLLGAEDSRFIIQRIVKSFSRGKLHASIEDPLVLKPVNLPPGIEQFPPEGNFAIWPPIGRETPQGTFMRQAPEVYLRRFLRHAGGGLVRENPAAAKYIHLGRIEGGSAGDGALPDAPDYLIPDLYLARRSGPTVELWVRGPAAARSVKLLNIKEIAFDR